VLRAPIAPQLIRSHRYCGDQALPADCGARFFEVDTHHDQQAVTQFAVERGKARRIVVRGLRVMDRAGADDGEQAVVAAVQHVADLAARVEHEVAHRVGQRQFLDEIARRRNRVELAYVHVHGLGDHRMLVEQCVLRTVRPAQCCHLSVSSCLCAAARQPRAVETGYPV